MLNHCFVNKNKPLTLVFVSGFGFGHEYFFFEFESVNSLWITPLSPFEFESQLLHLFDRYSISQFVCVGFSMGGFLVSSLKHCVPLASVLLGVGLPYSLSVLEPLVAYAQKDKGAMLSSFYRGCFFTDELYQRFCFDFESSFIELWTLESVCESLRYLSLAFVPKPLVPTALFHGEKDQVMPLKSALVLSKKFNLPLHVCNAEGHVLVDFFKRQPEFFQTIFPFLTPRLDII